MPSRFWAHQFQKIAYKLRLGLFGRAFLILFTILFGSISLWLFFFLLAQQEPRAIQLAEKATTIYRLTDRIFSSSSPERIPTLLEELFTISDTKVNTYHKQDNYTPLPPIQFWNIVASHLKNALDPKDNLVLAYEVNGEQDLWIKFQTGNGLNYWLRIDTSHFKTDLAGEWLYWALLAAFLSFIGSAFIAFFAHTPIKRITEVVKDVSQGKIPEELPENKGPAELRLLYGDLNRMVRELQQAESDRQLMLAGISHDLRTPLARIRLEIELNKVSEESKQAIDTDLDQIHQFINQIIDYARPINIEDIPPLNVSETLNQICNIEKVYTEELKGQFSYHIANDLFARISEINLKRVVSNIIENARRYGRDHDGNLDIQVKAFSRHFMLYIDIKDQGKGINTKDMKKILKPFWRGNQARTGVNGSGLGLPICERLLSAVGGKLRFLQNSPTGLICRIEIPLILNKNNQLDNHL